MPISRRALFGQFRRLLERVAIFGRLVGNQIGKSGPHLSIFDAGLPSTCLHHVYLAVSSRKQPIRVMAY